MACTKDVWHAGIKCYCYILSSTDFPKFLKHKQASCHLFSISQTISVVNLKSRVRFHASYSTHAIFACVFDIIVQVKSIFHVFFSDFILFYF